VEFLIVLVVLGVLAVAGAGVLWGRKYFRHEIERAKRIRRANRGK
jgi:type II secretory pathway pseudopilin PulG